MGTGNAGRLVFPKAILVIALFIWGIAGLRNPRAFDFIHGVDLVIHEFGHPLFGLLGNETLGFLGGTLMQMIMPLLFMGYFILQGQAYAAFVTLFWVGQNFTDIGVYVRDAQAQALPLVGGGIHDWNHLLSHWNALDKCGNIADALSALTAAAFFVMLVGGLLSSIEPPETSVDWEGPLKVTDNGDDPPSDSEDYRRNNGIPYSE